MRKLLLIAGAAAALALPSTAGARPVAAARLQVVEKEYSLTLSRLRVHTGKVILQVINFGMDNHDLVVQPTKGKAVWHTAVLSPQGQATKKLTLPPGKYTMFCSIPGHRQLGMVATLTVTR